MAKQPSKKPKPVTPSVEVKPPLAPPGWHKNFPFIITGVFFLLSLIGILFHEMWRDEYQAWMVASDATTIGELFRNLKYEGNPVLWHAFLYIFTLFTDDPMVMQIFHILISASFIYLINRYAPFSMLQKILLTFGYYTFYEFNIISRSYGLGFLLILIFCILYQNRQKYILYMAGILFLLANDTIFGVILTVCVSGILVLDWLFPGKKFKGPKIPFYRIALFVIIAGAGVFLGYIQIKPEADNSFMAFYVSHYDIVRLKFAFSRLIHAYFPIPNFTNFHFWNTNFFVPNEKTFNVLISPMIFLLWCIAFLRYRLILLLYVGGTLVLLVFYYYTGLIWSRYSGHLMVLLVICYWLLSYYREKPFRNKLADRLSLLGNKIRQPLYIVVLSVGLVGGVMTYAMDLIHPFSTSSKAADYLIDNQLVENEIIGGTDYVISPLASQIGKKIFYPERQEYGTFIIYDQKRLVITSFERVKETVRNKYLEGNKRMILIKDFPILMTFQETGETVPWLEGYLTDSLYVRLLTKIEPGIVQDEVYHIYSVDEVIR